jgi:hypothetical protein
MSPASKNKSAGSQITRQPIEQKHAASRPTQLARITKRQLAYLSREHRMTDV